MVSTSNKISLINTGINSGTELKLLNGSCNYNWKNLVKANPDVGSYGTTEAQFSGWENPTFNLTFHIPIDSIPTGTMTWALWNQFVKNQYDGTATTKTKLAITVGSTNTSFADYSADSTTSNNTLIPIQILGYSLSFAASDSANAGFWTINAQIMVTA